VDLKSLASNVERLVPSLKIAFPKKWCAVFVTEDLNDFWP